MVGVTYFPTMNWIRRFKLPGGHSFYQQQGANKWAIADDSIRNVNDPSTTDDGLLIIDTTRPCRIGNYGNGVGCTIPLIDSDGEWTHAGCDLQEIARCHERIGMSVHIEGVGTIPPPTKPENEG